MAHDRFEDRGRGPEQRGRPFDHDRDDRGFLERARDEVTSWFGDERDDYRRERDDRDDDRWASQGRERSPAGQRDYGRFERSPRWRDEGYRRPYTGRSGSSSSGDDDRYRPMTGDYGRSSSRQWEEDRQGRGEAMGSASGLHDRDYSSWRKRQIDDLDRDYDEFRRENSSRFESEFTTWRGNRQAKRQMLGQIREHMPVVGSDEQPVGTVDKVRGDRIVLTKDDSPDGRHQAISCALIDRVEGDRVLLDRKAEDAKAQFSSEDRNRALFERDDDRDPGAHILNRSFSGTY